MSEKKNIGFGIEFVSLPYVDLFNLAYSIGAFSGDDIEKQRACEFIKNAFDKEYFDIYNIHGSFESLKFKGFNKEWADFLMDKKNFLRLVEAENENSGFIARIHNHFNDIKENNGKEIYK